MREFDKLILDKQRNSSKDLIIKAYEGVLHSQRLMEKKILNTERQREYDKNRPP